MRCRLGGVAPATYNYNVRLAMNMLIKGGRVIDPSQDIDEILDILIVEGRIKELGRGLQPGKGFEVVHAAGLLVTPGLIDMHVHLRDPGLEYKEDIVSGTSAAAAGGFCSVACMPNTNPVNDNKAVTSYIINKTKAEGLVNVFPVGCITHGGKGDHLAEMGDLKEAGCVAVSDDGKPVVNSELMRRALEYAKGMGIMLITHSEDLSLVGEGMMNEGLTSTELGLKGISRVAEDAAVARDVYLAEFTDSPLHVAHVSTKGVVRIIRDAKARGAKVTCETAPHYFSLTDDAVRGYDTNAKMNPPLREDADVLAIKEGLRDGTIDAIATDHAPHHLDEKDVEFNLALNGIIGLETSVPLSLKLVEDKFLDIKGLVEKMSSNPSKILGIDRGTLRPGAVADVTVIDPDAEWVFSEETIHSKSKNSPFIGKKLKGRAVCTIVAGKIVYKLD